MPSLYVARVLRMKSDSSMPSSALNERIGGIVASPTPIVPISGDSITVIRAGLFFSTRASNAAAIQPAVPPPTIAMLCIGESDIQGLRQAAAAHGSAGLCSPRAGGPLRLPERRARVSAADSQAVARAAVRR